MRGNFERAPARVYWELTRACDLACRHCRAEALHEREPGELTTEECQGVLRQLAAAEQPLPHVIFTGGDPLKRPDLLALVRYAVALGLGASVAPSATHALTQEAVDALKAAGVGAMSLSLDGSTAARHDGIRGVPGCFDETVAAAPRITGAGIPLQINTLVTAETEPDLEAIAGVVAGLGAARWSLFFLISVGRGRTLTPLGAHECEATLRWLAVRARGWPFVLTTTEAPHYRRVLVESMRRAGASAHQISESPMARSFGFRDGNGIMFIAANGDVTPSGFLPLAAGHAREGDVLEIYREAPLFRQLREPDGFHGRCGICRFRTMCGGSRARAYAATGDVLGEDPLCAYEPAAVV
ncbi:MAG: radical SAM/SPASM domain-containing protein [Candidatus Rokubacteria bacterium RIFCSPHIGHO2_02_FULL_73_26]|nr:MAG: radical SAM/SPASM domain-containing protein [Candidatus Rokubacteria bacterium RIFCSPHIGHO2_02_FULL_73_26]